MTFLGMSPGEWAAWIVATGAAVGALELRFRRERDEMTETEWRDDIDRLRAALAAANERADRAEAERDVLLTAFDPPTATDTPTRPPNLSAGADRTSTGGSDAAARCEGYEGGD